VVLVEAGDYIPSMARYRWHALVDESASRRERPVIARAGGPKRSDRRHSRIIRWLVSEDGQSRRRFGRMIAMVEGAKRQKTPTEIALDILLAAYDHLSAGLHDLLPFSLFSVRAAVRVASPSRALWCV